MHMNTFRQIFDLDICINTVLTTQSLSLLIQCHESCPNDGGQDNTCILVHHSFYYMPFYDFGATQIFLTNDIYISFKWPVISLLSGVCWLHFPSENRHSQTVCSPPREVSVPVCPGLSLYYHCPMTHVVTFQL